MSLHIRAITVNFTEFRLTAVPQALTRNLH
jgi:hypothetical protein